MRRRPDVPARHTTEPGGGNYDSGHPPHGVQSSPGARVESEIGRMSGFKKFLLQGNLVQLAVAVVIGAVFSQLVTAFTAAFITPLLGVFGGVPEFAELTFQINGSVFPYGAFIDALISFLLTAAIVYFFVVMPIAKLLERFAEAEEATHRDCPACFTEISKKATRCPQCTSEIVPEKV